VSAEPGVRALIGLGSNLGDRLANLTDAIGRLAKTEGVEVTRASRVYETAPVGPPQPDYLNAVAEIWTSLSARSLMNALLSIEADLGRVRTERWGPRVIDLDLLNYAREEIDEPGLEVPHPRMHERAFVMVPLLELEADPLLPGGRTIPSLRLGPATLEGVRPFAPPIVPP
jgi:2-amino-4-hydroxy-6-hydroxymethyldihydropteridine diphosphokinase